MKVKFEFIIETITFAISLAGILGNILLWFVYSRRSLRSHSISVYFRALATIQIFCNLNEILSYYISLTNNYIANQYIAACKILPFVSLAF